jgi:hypothetical protein
LLLDINDLHAPGLAADVQARLEQGQIESGAAERIGLAALRCLMSPEGKVPS